MAGRPCNIIPSKEFDNLINFIRAKCLIDGKKPPSKTKITRLVANEINKERLWLNVRQKIR